MIVYYWRVADTCSFQYECFWKRSGHISFQADIVDPFVPCCSCYSMHISVLSTFNIMLTVAFTASQQPSKSEI